MKNNFLILAVVSAFLLIPVSRADEVTLPDQLMNEKSNFALSVHPLSTLGAGLQLNYKLTNYASARVGYYLLPYSVNDLSYEDDEGNTYITSGSVDFNNILAGVDIYPFQQSFKLTAGYVFMDSGVDAKAVPEGDQVTIDGKTYNTSTELESIDASVTLPSGGIYTGFGWGNATRNNQGWGFSTEIGVIFLTESPKVDISPNCVPNALTCHQIETSLEEDEAEIQSDLDAITFYPVFNIGISYQF